MNRRYQGFRVGVLGGMLLALGAVPGVAAPEDTPNRASRSQLLAQFPPPPPAQVPAQPPQPTGPVQTPQQPDVLVPNPQVTIDGVPVIAPGPVQVVPPFLPRAIAPPVGDIAVSPTAIRFGDTVDLGTAERVPRLVLRNAPAREVLSLLARAAGLNVVFVGGATQPEGGGGTAAGAADNEGPLVTVDLQNESVQEAFTSILRITGLQASRVGRTIYVGSRLPVSARNVVSRTLRMNQVSADGAAGFLASLGAEGTQVVTVTTLNNVAGGGAQVADDGLRIQITERSTETQIRPLTFTPGEGTRAAQILRGLLVSVDNRLNTVTLIGEPGLVETATSYLVQLDLRRRQVAVNVKVIDVNLTALNAIGTSFSFRVGGTTLASSGGVGIINFGSQAPLGPSPVVNPRALGSPIFPSGIAGQGAVQAAGQFLLQLLGTVQNGNAKILTDPTLVIQEGQQATLQLTQDVVTAVEVEEEDRLGRIITRFTPTIEPSGLTLEVNVPRIDDNGFITMAIAPNVTAPADVVNLQNNSVTLLSRRRLSSGNIRMRDGQTLVLAGIIQERDRVDVTRVPILGDLPIIGALFRSTVNTTDRAEVIVLVTPQILDDSDQAVWGYSYTPSEEVQELLQRSPRSPQR